MKLYIWRGVPGKRTPAAFFCGLDQIVSRPIGLDADENPNLLGLGERRLKFVKVADKKVNKGAVVEFFSAKDYLGPDPQGFPPNQSPATRQGN